MVIQNRSSQLVPILNSNYYRGSSTIIWLNWRITARKFSIRTIHSWNNCAKEQTVQMSHRAASCRDSSSGLQSPPTCPNSNPSSPNSKTYSPDHLIIHIFQSTPYPPQPSTIIQYYLSYQLIYNIPLLLLVILFPVFLCL